MKIRNITAPTKFREVTLSILSLAFAGVTITFLYSTSLPVNYSKSFSLMVYLEKVKTISQSKNSIGLFNSSLNFNYNKDQFHEEIAGNWRTRLIELQNTLSRIRLNFKSKSLNKLTISRLEKKAVFFNRTVISGKEIDYIGRIAMLHNQSDIQSYYYDWTYYNVEENKTDTALPVQRYFKPFATSPVCDNFISWWTAWWKKVVSCNSSEERQLLTSTNVSNMENAVSAHPFFNVSKLSTYINLIRNATITEIGSVLTDKFIILSGSCGFVQKEKLPDDKNDKYKVYDEVFVTTHFWGMGFFHMAIENLPRLAVYVDFLRHHPSIRIHVSNGNIRPNHRRTAEHAAASLAALGIDPKRRVYGIVKGRIIYLPRATPCGRGLLPEIQILAARYHDYIIRSLNESHHSSVVLIVRQSAQNSRNMPRHVYNSIQIMLTSLLANSSLKLEIFDDKKKLSHSETLRMFYRARMVIGLHGAGLANVIYSRPGTVVIEMICQPPGETNPCYIYTAGTLGHRYHAIPANGCPTNVNVNITVLRDVVAMYVNFIIQQLLL